MTEIAEAIDNSNGTKSFIRSGNPGVQELNDGSRYSDVIDEFYRIGRLEGIKQSALLTRDGLLIKDIPEKTCTGNSAAMMAVSLASAENAFAEIRKGIPDMMVLCMDGEKIIIKGAGPRMLLTAIIDDKVNDIIVLPMIEKTAEIIKSMS